MNCRTLDTFTESLARLNGAEQKAVNTTDLQLTQLILGLSIHILDQEVYDTEHLCCTSPARGHGSFC